MIRWYLLFKILRKQLIRSAVEFDKTDLNALFLTFFSNFNPNLAITFEINSMIVIHLILQFSHWDSKCAASCRWSKINKFKIIVNSHAYDLWEWLNVMFTCYYFKYISVLQKELSSFLLTTKLSWCTEYGIRNITVFMVIYGKFL